MELKNVKKRRGARLKFLYVVGAGASLDFGFPSGNSLKSKIKDSLVWDEMYDRFDDEDIQEAILTLRNPQYLNLIVNHVEISKKITNGLYSQPSIDNFVHAHSEDATLVNISKLCIYNIIRRCEYDFARSVLSGAFNLENTWVNKFFHSISTLCTLSQFKERVKNIGFVIFNYDMCFEYCFARTIADRFLISYEEASDIVSEITIIHPYGSTKNTQSHYSNYRYHSELGRILTTDELVKQFRNIRTFSESTENESETGQVANMIANAQNIVFLGYGYNDVNQEYLLSKLKSIEENRIYKTIFGTAKGLSVPDRVHIKNNLKSTIKWVDQVYLEDESCVDMFSQYSKALSYRELS